MLGVLILETDKTSGSGDNKDGRQRKVAEGVRCGSLVGLKKYRKIRILKGSNLTFIHLIWGLYSPKLEVMPPEILQVINQAWAQILDLDALLNRKLIPRLP